MPQAALLDLAEIGGTMTLKGPLQAGTKGEKQFVWVVAFTHESACTMDPKTGLPQSAGPIGDKTVLKQSPFIITKKLDYTTPLLHKAYRDGAVLTPWKLHLFQIPASGPSNNYFVISLTGAKIQSIRTIKPSMLTQNVGQAHEVEEVAFSYATITFEALSAPRGMDLGGAPPDSHGYPSKVEPDWKWVKAKAEAEKQFGLLPDKLVAEVKAALVADGILTVDGLPGENFSK